MQVECQPSGSDDNVLRRNENQLGRLSPGENEAMNDAASAIQVTLRSTGDSAVATIGLVVVPRLAGRTGLAGAELHARRWRGVELSPARMLIVHVHVRVKPECVEAFRQACLENARQSVREPGIARFDVCQQADDPTRFVLVEVYRHADAPARHKETAHYARWRDAVASMMAEPRTSVKFASVFPDDPGW